MIRPERVDSAPATPADGLGSGVSVSPVPVTVRFEVPVRTIVTVLAVLAVLWLLAQLWTLLLSLFVALLLTAALDPPVSRLERRGVPRAASIAIFVLALVGIVAGIAVLVVPPLIEQGNQLVDAAPGYLDRLRSFTQANPEVFTRVQEATAGGDADPRAVASGFLAAGAGLFRGISAFLIVLVMTAYLLADGERIYDWSVRYLPTGQRIRVRQALPEISRVVSGYLLGQFLTSLLFGVFTYVVLSILGVPQPLLLAILAAVADAIPVVGVIIATVPAVLLALTVSPPTAGIVLALYLAYQQVENYLIVPRVYRGTLELHPFAVLLAVLVGAQLLGILGVLLALPIAAAVPVIERIWGSRGTTGPAASPPVPDAGAPIPPEQTRPDREEFRGARMTEQERHEPLPDMDRADAEVRPAGGGPRTVHEDAETPTNQAVSNQEQALESGEENVV